MQCEKLLPPHLRRCEAGQRKHLQQFYQIFFFSSRRRHTRWPRDWSSDVCSSDLRHRHIHFHLLSRYTGRCGGHWHVHSHLLLRRSLRVRRCCRHLHPRHIHLHLLRRCCRRRIGLRHVHRSEERRVGKECR